MSDAHLSSTTFADLDLPAELMQSIDATGFSYCTPIQAETLPVALQGRDVAGQAQTGTGKTAAFLIATFAHLMRHPAPEGRKTNQPRALILAPTRELAVQIHKDALALGQHTDFRLGLVYGGTGYESQRQQLEDGVDVLIGTPGRIIDYFKQHIFNLKALQVLVLDEADRMFDLGFIKDIRYLLHRMPEPAERLSMLFSATLSYRVQELAYEHMNNPQKIEVAPEQVTAKHIVELAYYPSNDEKIPFLLGILGSSGFTRAVIFVNTKRVGEKIDAFLQGNGYPAALLTGDVPQQKRQRLLNEFTEGKLNILVATDVAARGLHIPEVSHVINFDLPQDAEDYVHRIGRTARAGASGTAISFACEQYVFSLPEIEEYIGHRIPTESVDPALLIKPKPPIWPERKAHSGNKRPFDRNKKSGGQRRSSAPRPRTAKTT
ncbi:MAG: ATP-dependent RNA helicase RhlB [Gammaproteobacteria bacterium]